MTPPRFSPTRCRRTTRPFDVVGTIPSAAGLACLVMGILQADNNLALMAILLAAGALLLAWFFLHVRAQERAGEEPLLSTALFANRTSNLALATQNVSAELDGPGRCR